jgi:hypothetical protein
MVDGFLYGLIEVRKPSRKTSAMKSYCVESDAVDPLREFYVGPLSGVMEFDAVLKDGPVTHDSTRVTMEPRP